MKPKLLPLLGLVCALVLLTGCTSMLTFAPYPVATPWGPDVRTLGEVKADSGAWPLSLHSTPPAYTFYSALQRNAASKYSVPEDEVVVGEVSVKIGAELDGTIRDWHATAIAGRRKAPVTSAKSAADELLELKKLLDAGAITPEEYAAKKQALLEKM